MFKAIKNLLSEDTKERYRLTWYRFRRLFVRPKFPQNSDGKVYIHLGSGKIDHPQFINIDALPLPHIHFVSDVEKLPMLKDGSIDLIYCCHCLEHISFLRTHDVLTEWHNKLKPGGTLRLSVPDFDLILKIYQDQGCKAESILATLMGGQEYEFNFHKTIFTQEYLFKLLAEAGFTNVRTWKHGETDLTNFNDWSGRNCKYNGKSYPISLNVEGSKPA